MIVSNYAIVDPDTDEILNIVLWDGESDWVAPEGMRVQIAPEGARIGDDLDPEGVLTLAPDA